jgi:hypothetical protein
LLGHGHDTVTSYLVTVTVTVTKIFPKLVTVTKIFPKLVTVTVTKIFPKLVTVTVTVTRDRDRDHFSGLYWSSSGQVDQLSLDIL